MSEWHEAFSIDLDGDDFNIMLKSDSCDGGNMYVSVKVSEIIDKLPPDPCIQKMLERVDRRIAYSKNGVYESEKLKQSFESEKFQSRVTTLMTLSTELKQIAEKT